MLSRKYTHCCATQSSADLLGREFAGEPRLPRRVHRLKQRGHWQHRIRRQTRTENPGVHLGARDDAGKSIEQILLQVREELLAW